MWWVRNVWLWVWAGKEEKGPGASWRQLEEGSSPQRGLEEHQKWWLLSTVPRGLRGLYWLYRDHLLQAIHFIFRKTETQEREGTGHGDISVGEGTMRSSSHFCECFPNLSTQLQGEGLQT